MTRDNYKTMAVVNPQSANGSTKRRWDEIADAIRKHLGGFEYVMTTKPCEATELTQQAIKDGFEMILAVGGDGTNNEVVNGFFENGVMINPDAVMTSIPRGTGGDFRKTTGLPKELAEAAQWLSGKATRTIDVGRMTLVDHEGADRERYFINIATFGVGGEIDRRVNETTKAFGGFASFAWASLVSTLAYKNKAVEIFIDGHSIGVRKVYSCGVCNGRFCGGGMMYAPDAKLDDGLFDIILMEDLSAFEILTQMPKIYSGRHIEHPKISVFQGKKVKAVSDEEVLHDVDGEAPGRLPSEYEILPGSLKIKIPG